jgi:hypothetical protein
VASIKNDTFNQPLILNTITINYNLVKHSRFMDKMKIRVKKSPGKSSSGDKKSSKIDIAN